MARIKELITEKTLKNRITINSQKLAACMGWQILNDYPGKVKANNWDMYKNLRGVMLADEVGAGKTFEALAIISKAYLNCSRGTGNLERFRVLILANPSVRSKWSWGNCNLNFSDFSDENYKTNCDLEIFIKQTDISKRTQEKLFDFFSKQKEMKSKKLWSDVSQSGNGKFKPRQGIWLASFSGLPATKGFGKRSKFDKKGKVFPANFFDWIIVDEAHSLKSGSLDEVENIKLHNSAIRKIYAVVNSNINAKLLLLTATPFQNNLNEFKHLLSLVEKIDGKNKGSSFTKIVSKGLEKLEEEFNNIKNENYSLDKVITELKEFKNSFDNDINELIGLKGKERIERPNELRASGNRNGIDDYLRDVMVRNVKKQLEIKPEIAQLNEKGKLQYLLYRDLVKKSEDEKQMFSTKLSQMVSSEESFSNKLIDKNEYNEITSLFGKNLVFEEKFKKLREIIDKIIISNEKTVITIFISWKQTLAVIESRLKKSRIIGKVFRLSGEDKIENRKNILEEIEKANRRNSKKKKIILLVSRVGNECLDFDKFSNRIIHYDNNFNPAVIDQRNGRVYRNKNIITKKGKVMAGDIEIYQLFLEETYDQRILFLENEKRILKNFYLGDSSLQKIFERIIVKNNLKEEHKLIKILDSIRIDLTPRKKNLLAKNRKEFE